MSGDDRNGPYVYTDEHGEPLYRVKRSQRDGKKTFTQQHREGGKWRAGRNGTAPVPYRLPRLVDAIKAGRRVLIVEGEKDVHAAEAEGVVATTNPAGAGKWTDELSEHFRGAVDVDMVYDDDEPGHRHAWAVAESLKRVDVEVTFFRAADGKDLSDHLDAGLSVDELDEEDPPQPSVATAKPKQASRPERLPRMYSAAIERLREFAAHRGLPAPRKHPNREQYEACCPAHDDRNPSLGVKPGDETAVALYCQAGCEPEAIVTALGIDWSEFLSAPTAGEEEDDVLALVMREMAIAKQEDDRTDHLDKSMTPSELFAMPKPEWLVDEYIPAVGITVVYGSEGVGKTLLVGSVTLAVATGTKWFDRAVPEDGSPVLFYAGEGASGLADRWRAWIRRFAPKLAETPVEDWDLTVRLVPEAVNLEDEHEVANVIRTVRAMREEWARPVGLVVLDSFLEFLGGNNEKESLDKASRAARVIAKLCQCSVVIGHHPNAAGQDRGTRHLSFRAHARFKMERWEGSEETWLVAEKQRDGAKLAMELVMAPVGDSVVFDKVREVPAEEFVREKAKRLAESAEDRRQSRSTARTAERVGELRERVLDALPANTEEPLSTTKIRTAVGAQNARVVDALASLVEDGAAERIEGDRNAALHRRAS